MDDGLMRTTRRALLSIAAVAGLPVSARATSARFQLATTFSGKITYTRNTSIWAWENGQTSEILNGDNISDPRWSPDGSSLIYVRTGNSFSDLYTYSLTSGAETQLTANQPPYDIGSVEYMQNSSWVIDPDWSKSGLIGFISDAVPAQGALAVFLMSSVAEAPYLALMPETYEEDIFNLQLSADGSLAIYTVRVRLGDASSGTYVALRDLNNGSAYQLAESKGDQFDPALSPDNAWAAMTIRDQSGVTDLWIVHIESGERTRLTRGQNAMSPRWSPNGQSIAWIRMDNYKFEIWAATFDNGNISGETRLVDEDGIDPLGGLSWWMDSSINAGG